MILASQRRDPIVTSDPKDLRRLDSAAQIIPVNHAALRLIEKAAHRAIRQGERSAHVFKAAVAHDVDLSARQTLHAFGIFRASLIAGVTKLKVWLRTLISAIVT